MDEEAECAKFVIDTVEIPFTLNGIAKTGEQYTLSFWSRSDDAGCITVCGKKFKTNGEWNQCMVTFSADSEDLKIFFDEVGTYFIYRPQLEIGSVATDYVPAPEDIDESIDSVADDLDATDENLATIYNSVSELSIKAGEISGSVSEIQSTLDTATGDIKATKEEIASMKLESSKLEIDIQNISNNGVNKVVTETGFTFDREGMMVDATDSPTQTQITPDGMHVYKKDAAGDKEEVLEATSEGVDAINLHAKTYLIIGGLSRFESYGADRTGCFWIGG